MAQREQPRSGSIYISDNARCGKLPTGFVALSDSCEIYTLFDDLLHFTRHLAQFCAHYCAQDFTPSLFDSPLNLSLRRDLYKMHFAAGVAAVLCSLTAVHASGAATLLRVTHFEVAAMEKFRGPTDYDFQRA